jgi:Tfp pilus assembly protein PilN
MRPFLKNILLGKQYIGIEFFSINHEEKIAFLQAEKKKDGLVIAKHNIFLNKEELLLEKNNAPAVLVINNAQVLQKEIQGTDPNDKKLLHKAFPNLQLEEFYYEIWRKGTISLISICRKSYVDELIVSLKDGFKIASVGLGLSPIGNMVAFSIPSVINTNTHTIDLDSTENMVQSGNMTPSVLDVNGLQISSHQLLGFAGILQLILQQGTTGSIQELNTHILDNFNQGSFFEKTLKTGIALLLCVLLVNFLFFSHYFDKAAEAEETVLLNKAGIGNIVKIKERIISKENALNSFTGNSGSRSTVLLNTIVKSIPTSILLSEIEYHPIEKKVKKEEPILSQDKFISISGNTISNEDFTLWVENLGGQPEIENVTIASFGKDPEGNTIFTINITVR